jgi:hypothetical protein
MKSIDDKLLPGFHLIVDSDEKKIDSDCLYNPARKSDVHIRDALFNYMWNNLCLFSAVYMQSIFQGL